MREPVDQFGRVPLRFSDALQLGEVTFRQFCIGSYLVCRCWQDRHKRVITNLRALKSELGYSESLDTLRRDLNALREGGWIDFDVSERQRRPVEIHLTRLEVIGSAAERDRQLTQRDGGMQQSVPQPPSAPGPRPQRGSEDQSEEARGSAGGSDPLSSSSPSSSLERDSGTTTTESEGELQQEEPPWRRHVRDHPYLYGTDDPDEVMGWGEGDA